MTVKLSVKLQFSIRRHFVSLTELIYRSQIYREKVTFHDNM